HSLTHSHTHTNTHSHTHLLTNTHTYSVTNTHTHTNTHSHTHLLTNTNDSSAPPPKTGSEWTSGNPQYFHLFIYVSCSVLHLAIALTFPAYNTPHEHTT